MSGFITNIFNFITSDIRATILSVILGLIVYYFAKFYLKVLSLPSGPIPLPIIGNILLFRGTKRHSSIELIELSKNYGPVFTFWMGPKPFIMIFDRDIARETFRRNEFAGRPDSYFGKQLSNEEYSDVVFADYGPTWESLRRVTHNAVRKYSTSDDLAYLVTDVVDETVKFIKEKEGINKPFSPYNYIYLLFLNILASSVFGKRYGMDDEEFKKIKYFLYDFVHEIGNRFILWEFMPIMRLIDRKLLKKQYQNFSELKEMMKNKYIDHYKDFSETVTRDFCDALISAKNEALAEGKESAPYLTDDNLSMSALDLFFAGIDTSQFTFKWIFYFLAYYPEVQKKLRQEISSEIGDRIPLQEDRNNCHYVNAYISETMRFRNIAPLGVFHKAIVQTRIGDLSIPEGTGVFVHQYSILNDEKYWKKPNEFKPERFLENDKFLSSRPSAFIPFGLGRRVCLGEKLALADLFLVLVRFLQATDGYEIVLENEQQSYSLEPDLNTADTIVPVEYKVLLKKIV